MAEVLIGYIILGVLISIFANKLARRRDQELFLIFL